MKKLACLFLSLVMATALLTSCGSASSESKATSASTPATSTEAPSAEKPTVRILMFGLNEDDVTDPISGLVTVGATTYEALLNEKNPDVNVEVIAASWDNWIQKIETMADNGEMDISFYSNQVDAPNWFADSTPFMEADADVSLDNWKEIFIDPATHYTEYRTFSYPDETGKIFGLPMCIASQCITYDSQLFADWGVPEPTGKETMEELVALTDKMTGKNPVTGRQNYGAYIESSWTEWYAVSYDAVKKLESDTMLLSEIDKDEYVEYIKDSPEVLNYMEGITKLVANAPAGVSTSTGKEKYFTPDNDIAINFTTKSGQEYTKYLEADMTEITDRFKPILLPAGAENGEAGFPEVTHFAVTKNASDPQAAWEVLKSMTTDKELVDFYMLNYGGGKAPVLKDVDGMKCVEKQFIKDRYEHTMNTMYITDDYWMWRDSLREVNNLLMSKELTPEEARTAFYEGVSTWYDDTVAQLG